jgi:glyoxalase family protein
MKHPILGLHHVTATVDDAQSDLDFYLDTLGLRLVKKTVNFDNHNVYHFYYGDERGTPGTIWTTFPYKGWGVPPGQPGLGQISVTSFSVPAASLSSWKTRLQPLGVQLRDLPPVFGEPAIELRDPSGLTLHLMGSNADNRLPWTGSGVGAEAAIRGLHSVTMTVAVPGPTIALLTELLGFEIVNEAGGRIRLAVNGDEPGKRIDILPGSGLQPARNGLGTVHHMAMAISTPEEQVRLRQELIELGYRVTEVLDRQYFLSIYFREPGGVLFEAATLKPGFTVDERLDELGRDLKLPSWEEPDRAAIVQKLPRVTYRGAPAGDSAAVS